MRKIIAENLPFEQRVVSRAEALELFRARGEIYKVEIIESIPESGADLVLPARRLHRPVSGPARRAHRATSRRSRSCRSPAPTGAATSATASCSGSTARRSRRPTSSRPTWPRIEEAKRRDHRVLGKTLDLFSMDDLVGPGFVLWHPKGAFVRYQIEEIIRRENVRRGYDLVYTPHVAREQLLETSGHLAHYKENLFGGMELDGQRYLVKPMNCPFHAAIYRSQMRSYRELPIRYSELGTVYRYERSGVLHGLLRVRGLTMDDGHLFVREDQIGEEMTNCLKFSLEMLKLVRLRDLRSVPGDPPRELHGRAGRLGSRRGDPARRAGIAGQAVRGRRRRRRVLRAQDRSQDPGRARPALAVLDVPARLPDPRAVRARVRRARTARASARS